MWVEAFLLGIFKLIVVETLRLPQVMEVGEGEGEGEGKPRKPQPCVGAWGCVSKKL